MSDTEDLEREAQRREAERERDRQAWERKQEEDRRKMPRVRLILAMLVALITTSLAIPTMATAATTPVVTDIGTPAVACTQDHGLWRVYGHLVFVMEYCTQFSASSQDTVVIFMGSYDNPKDRCDHKGGRFEFIGSPEYFNLKICWSIDHIIVPGASEITNALGSTRCTQDHGYWRVYNHLVFVLESCTSYNVSPPDSLVIFMDPNVGDPVTRCLNQGGRYERIGNPASFNLTICWDVDYSHRVLTFVNPPWDGVTPRVCVDIDGGPVTENQSGTVVSYTLEDPKLNPETTDAIMQHLQDKFTPWTVVFMLGECLDANSATLYITTKPAPQMPLWANGDSGYAYINGFGVANSNVGFVFMQYLNTPMGKAVAVHEVGHLFGLDHPLFMERSIMSDGSDPSLTWNASDIAWLNQRLVPR